MTTISRSRPCRLTAFILSVIVAATLPGVAEAADSLPHGLAVLAPWEFSPTVLVCSLLALLVYGNGLRQRRARGLRSGFWRPLAYFIGVVSLYAVLQTRVDYDAAHMFYIHRLQHLVLHHIGPFLIALAQPQKVLRAGIPDRWWQRVIGPVLCSAPVQWPLRFLMDPILAPVLFVGGIAIWLAPTIHFYAMLGLPLYNLMNWSMIVDGLPFWWLVLNPAPKPPARIGYGTRILILMAVMVPQMAIGAYIALARHDLFNVYGICGRLYPLSPITDQQIGGLIIWIPGSMMSIIAALVVLSNLRHGVRRAAAP